MDGLICFDVVSFTPRSSNAEFVKAHVCFVPVCEQHLPLLFKILETSKDPVVRSNIVIALGDIAVCFGNLIDDVSNFSLSTMERS